MRPLRILAVTLRYPPYTAGGYELLTRDAVEGLRERGHEVTLLTGRGHLFEGPDVLPWLAPELDGEVEPFQRSFQASNAERFQLHFFRLANYRATAKALRWTDADLVLFFNLSLVSLAPVLAARHASVPTLGYVADPWPENHWLRAWRENDESARKRFQLDSLTRFWHAFRSTVGLGRMLVCSRYLRDALAADGLAHDQLPIVPLALAPDLAAAAADARPAARGAGEPLRVVCTSSLWEGKGQDVLIEAVDAAVRQGADVELRLVGGGTDGFRVALERRVHELGLGERVRFDGRVPREELVAILRESHVLAMPSTWGEPFGMATIEGMVFGLATVVSDAGASPEIVEHGVDGLVVRAGEVAPLARALAQLARDDELRVELARAGQETVARRYAHVRFLDDLEREARRASGSRA